MVEKNWGKRNFGRDSLKSMNRGIGGKRDCTPGAELPVCRRAPRAGAAGLPSELPAARRRSFSGGVLLELNCRQSFAAAPAGVLRELKSPAGVARRQSGSSAPGVQSRREKEIVLPEAGAELPPSSPRRSCSSAGPQNRSYALIGGELGSGSFSTTSTQQSTIALPTRYLYEE
ncbi:unnamed protein product [Boreogadus saida]